MCWATISPLPRMGFSRSTFVTSCPSLPVSPELPFFFLRCTVSALLAGFFESVIGPLENPGSGRVPLASPQIGISLLSICFFIDVPMLQALRHLTTFLRVSYDGVEYARLPPLQAGKLSTAFPHFCNPLSKCSLTVVVKGRTSLYLSFPRA